MIWVAVLKGLGRDKSIMEFCKDHPYIMKAGLAVGAAGVAAGAVVLAKWSFSRKNLPPGPRGLPLVGSALSVDLRGHLHKQLKTLGDKYGPVFSLYIGSKLVVVLNSQQAIREAFSKKGSQFSDRHADDADQDSFQDEIIMPNYSEKWRADKRFAEAAFRVFTGPKSDMEEYMLQRIEVLKESIVKENNHPINPSRLLKLCAASVMMKIMFGEELSQDQAEVDRMIDEWDQWDYLFNEIYPGYELLPSWIQNWFYQNELKELENMLVNTYEICEEQLSKRKSRNYASDVFGHYIKHRNAPDGMGGVDIFFNTITGILLDPVETLSTLISWTILYLAYFPENQILLQQELNQVVGRHSRVTMDHQSSLPLTQSFLLEVQRHCSITSTSLAHATNSPGAEIMGYHIPPSACIVANFYAVHMDPDIHPDPEQFQADRFIGDDGKFKRSEAVMIFGIGPRRCPGEHLTRKELFLVIANLISAFDIHFPRGQQKPSLEMIRGRFFKLHHDYKVSMTLRQK